MKIIFSYSYRSSRDNIFKIRAYRKVARSIQDLILPVEQLVAENRLDEIPGAGEAITKKIKELVATGKLDYYDRLKKEIQEQNQYVTGQG